MAYSISPITDLLQAAGAAAPNASVNAPFAAAQAPPPVPGRLTKNPDGSSTDPATGVTYVTNPDGSMTPAHDPNTANQVAANTIKANADYAQVPGYDAREAGAYAQQGALANTLTNMAAGNGPTVAGTQLATGLDQASRQQLAQAAGTSGNNAALARMGAASNTANLQAQTNQQQAVARAGEETNAINSLGNVTGAMDTESAGMGNNKTAAGNYLNGLASTGENNYENLREKASNDQATVNAGIDEANAKATGGGISTALSFL